MKTVSYTHRNGIATTGTIAINPRLIVKYANNASTKCVIRLDVEPGSKSQPVSFTLDVAKTVVDAIMATDQTINLITANVLNAATGVTTATSFNEAYLVSLKDTKAYINGAIDASVVEFVYSDGGFQNKTLIIDGTLAALVASNAAEILTYSFAAVTGEVVVINSANRTIAVEVPFETVVSSLAATFTISANLTSIVVGATPQVSTSTANNFSAPVVYVLTAEDGVTQRSWTITVTVAAE